MKSYNQKGASLLEYSLIGALIAVIVITSVIFLGRRSGITSLTSYAAMRCAQYPNNGNGNFKRCYYSAKNVGSEYRCEWEKTKPYTRSTLKGMVDRVGSLCSPK